VNRAEMRRCGKQYATEEEAFRSKAGQRPGAEVESCRCGGYHVTTPKPAGDGKPRKAARDTGPSQETRAMVYARDGARCVCCGLSIVGQVHSVQHRKRRSQGGTNDLSNLITVLGDGTTGHNARIDSRIDPHDEAKGYTVRSWQDPREVGVMIFDSPDGPGVTKWLSDDGAYLDEAPEWLAA
jgi:hypothetical protein